MLQVERRANHEAPPSDTLTLSYDERRRSRLRVRSDSGVDVLISLPQSSAMREGDLLEAQTGEVLRVCAAREPVSEASTGDPLQFARAVYQMGLRHVPLQVAVGVLRYRHDEALDRVMASLGLSVTEREAAFEPEVETL
ncbi:MAG TPA: hypothetical protein VHM19_17190 [Polyangiales bacterium]|jgi:urease accessory protein|nr:hypothetical protein [Polyangiales bacterium]